MKTVMNSQLELSFSNLGGCCAESHRRARAARARAWFQLMRDLIDNTAQWQPGAPALSASNLTGTCGVAMQQEV